MNKLFNDENKIIPIILIAIILLLFMAVALVLFFRFARKKIIQKELEKATIKIENQKKILQATIETQERERKRIAQDLHDAISAKLNVLNLHANMLMDKSLNPDEESNALSNIVSITMNVLDNSRQIAHNLLPPILSKFGLKAALEELLNEFESTKKVRIKSNINYRKSLTKNEELHLFRILQEFINNSIKHANATELRLEIIETTDELVIVYKDNGIGFNVKKALNKNGLGLKNIKSRVAILNGTLFIDSLRGKGSTFNIKIIKTEL
jgi:signal transduction histidine kinase